MKLRSRRLLLSVLTGLLLAQAPMTAMAQGADPSTAQRASEAAYVGVDIFPLRVLGFCRLVIGTVAMVPISIIDTIALPYHMDGNVYRENYERLMVEPFEYVFQRPLGESLAGG